MVVKINYTGFRARTTRYFFQGKKGTKSALGGHVSLITCTKPKLIQIKYHVRRAHKPRRLKTKSGLDYYSR